MMRSTEPKRIRTSHFRGRGVTAALPPFKRTGKGSNPFGPISRRQASGLRKKENKRRLRRGTSDCLASSGPGLKPDV